jgi:hypothetical protein
MTTPIRLPAPATPSYTDPTQTDETQTYDDNGNRTSTAKREAVDLAAVSKAVGSVTNHRRALEGFRNGHREVASAGEFERVLAEAPLWIVGARSAPGMPSRSCRRSIPSWCIACWKPGTSY